MSAVRRASVELDLDDREPAVGDDDVQPRRLADERGAR
jgi:hypothetical protein